MKTEYDFSKARRGPVKPDADKTRVTLYLSNDVLAYFRDVATREGLGYQTVISQALLRAMKQVPGTGANTPLARRSVKPDK